MEDRGKGRKGVPARESNAARSCKAETGLDWTDVPSELGCSSHLPVPLNAKEERGGTDCHDNYKKKLFHFVVLCRKISKPRQNIATKGNT